MKKILLAIALIFSLTKITQAQIVYTLSSCGYAPIAGGGTALPACDDCMSGMVPLGFTFSFYGINYTQCDIASNGFLTFNGGMAPTYPGQIMPYAPIPAMIAFSWDDMYTVGATYNYFTTGIAPNRIFVLNYNNVGYCCSSSNAATVQVQLYETTNEIRILSSVNNHIGRTATMGIQSIGNGAAVVVPGRNAQSWSAGANECQSFFPGPPPPPVNDNPCAAIALTASSVCFYSFYTNTSATATGGIPAPGCAGYGGGDVWFSVVVPAGGALNFDTQTGVMLDGGMAVYSGTCAAMALIACDDNNSPNGAMPYLSLTGLTVGSTLWIRVWENGNNNNGSFGICVVDPNAPPPVMGNGAVYIGSNAGDPWGSTSNQDAMTTVFGGAWTQAYFETINPATTFVNANCFVYIEGGDFTSTTFENFLNANMTLMESWVAIGGRLIINGAPNVGGNINYGFGGVLLNYDGGSSLAWDGNATAGQAGHPIFNGPFLPCGTAFTSNYFAHAWISGGGTTSLMDYLPAPGPSLTEKVWGAGRVMFGGMTTANWHNPHPEGENLIANIISYQANCLVPLPVELTAFSGECSHEGSVIRWTTSTEINNKEFVIESSADGITYVSDGKVGGAGNSNVVKEYSYVSPLRNTPGNYFRLKQVDFDGTEKIFSPIYITCDGNSNNNCAVLNVNNEQIELDIYSTQDEEVTCSLLDVRGSLMRTVTMHTSKGINSININAHGLASGVYLVTITGADHQCTSKFLKH